MKTRYEVWDVNGWNTGLEYDNYEDATDRAYELGGYVVTVSDADVPVATYVWWAWPVWFVVGIAAGKFLL